MSEFLIRRSLRSWLYRGHSITMDGELYIINENGFEGVKCINLQRAMHFVDAEWHSLWDWVNEYETATVD